MPYFVASPESSSSQSRSCFSSFSPPSSSLLPSYGDPVQNNIDTGDNTIRFTIGAGSGGGGDPGGGGDQKCIDVTMMLNMKNGMMYVDDVSIGDMVRTYNMETKTDEYVEIEDIIRGPHYVYNVGLEDETLSLIHI